MVRRAVAVACDYLRLATQKSTETQRIAEQISAVAVRCLSITKTKPSPAAAHPTLPKEEFQKTIANESPPISGRVNLQLQPFNLCVTAMMAYDFAGLKHVGVLRWIPIFASRLVWLVRFIGLMNESTSPVEMLFRRLKVLQFQSQSSPF